MRLVPMCVSAALALAVASSAHATLITLDTADRSSCDASIYSTVPADYNTTALTVTSLPYTAPSTADGASSDSSTVTPNLSNTGLYFTYSEFLADPADYYADSDGDILFVAGANVQYTIAGTETASQATDEFIVELSDHSIGQTVYDFDQFDSTSFTLPSGAPNGSLTGTLTPGDTYEFYADENLSNGTDPTLTGNVSITFSPAAPAVPEPAAAIMLLAGALLITATRTRYTQRTPQAVPNPQTPVSEVRPRPGSLPPSIQLALIMN